MRIAIVGAGYVGLVSGACFADFGHEVTCVDKDASKISMLQRGKIPIFEPDLDRLVQNNVKNGRLNFDTDLAGPVREADAVFIAVGTPPAAAMVMPILAMFTRWRGRSRLQSKASRW